MPTQRTAQHKGIGRAHSDERGGYYWHVALQRDGKPFQKSFPDKRYGGEQNALKLAQAWRDMIVSEHPPMSMAKFCGIVRSNNTSGVPGVFRCIKRRTSKNGLVSERAYWQARLPVPDGKWRQRNFSVLVFGEECARQHAIDARLKGLNKMEEISFRTRSEPQPISTREDIAQLNAALRMLDVRRLERSKEREDKRQLVRLRTKEKLEKVLALEMQALKTPTNKSGEPYIGRYRNSKGEGYHWHVSIIRKGVRHRKSFSDSVYGGKDKSLLAAKSWRDEIFLSAPWGNMATSVARIKANNTSGVAGVTLTRHERGGKDIKYWTASSPKKRGQPNKSKKYSLAKYGDLEAFSMAVKAREAFVAELRAVGDFHHRVARQLKQILIKNPP